ncbi:hypothetical protein KQI41_17755 [Tissierella pigra]|uniref:hypothetical protein n=1 Tax=Tissierella pigra TaxID=2607614 RepID=UPI001C1180DB|nr:hypothetical protein [Tissierella pigra]MBU5428242.1 hypothetical protein [Tissierella pigra]
MLKVAKKIVKVLSLFLALMFLIPTTFVKAEQIDSGLIDLTSQEISESRVINYDEMIEILVEDGYIKSQY